MLSTSLSMDNCDTKIQLLLAKPCRSKWEGRTLTPTYFSHTKVGGSSSTKGWVQPPNPRQITLWTYVHISVQVNYADNEVLRILRILKIYIYIYIWKIYIYLRILKIIYIYIYTVSQKKL